MTIIYLYRSLAAFGGVERIFIDKANYLAEHYGYHVYIITWEQGGTFHRLPFITQSDPYRLGHTILSPVSIWAFQTHVHAVENGKRVF